MPDSISLWPGLADGAKLVYGRLVKYAGQRTIAFPRLATLGSELGMAEEKVRRHIRKLEAAGLLRRVPHYSRGRQTSNEYEFIWHPMLVLPREPAAIGPAPRRPNEFVTPGDTNSVTPINASLEMHRRLGHSAAASPAADFPYSGLRSRLHQYLTADGKFLVDPPSEHLVRKLMAACEQEDPQVDEAKLIGILNSLYETRGLKPGKKSGPRAYAWFQTVILDVLRERRAFEVAAHPERFMPSVSESRLPRGTFEALTNVL